MILETECQLRIPDTLKYLGLSEFLDILRRVSQGNEIIRQTLFNRAV